MRIEYDRLLKKHGVDPKQTRAGRTRAAEQLVKWCEKHEINAEDYLGWYVSWALHSGAPLEMYRLRSNSFAAKWKEEHMGAGVAEQRVFSEKQAAADLDKYAHLRPITRAQEAQRQRYTQRGTQDVCVIERASTGGYDARSRFCPSCPQASPCHHAHNQDYGIDVARYRLETHVPKKR